MPWNCTSNWSSGVCDCGALMKIVSHAVAQPFLGEQHLVGVLAAEPIRRQHQHGLDLAFGDEVAHSFQAGSNQRGSAEALVLEDPLSRYAVALA